MTTPITHAVEVEKHEPPELPGFWMLQCHNGAAPYFTSGYVTRDDLASLRRAWEMEGRGFREVYIPSESEAAQQRLLDEARERYIEALEAVPKVPDTYDVHAHTELKAARAAYEAARQELNKQGA